MKDNKFWKIMAIIFMVWLFLFLWMQRFKLHENALVKFNRITGKAELLRLSGSTKESENSKVPYIVPFERKK